MRWNSVWIRLILWNVLVIALVLGAFGVALTYTVRASLADATDQELEDRGHMHAERTARFINWGQRPDSSRRPARRPETAPANPGAAGPVPPESLRRTPPPGASEQERRGFYRRPRILDRDGNSLIPFSDDIPWDDAMFLLSAHGGLDKYGTVVLDGELVRVFSTPIRRDGQIEGAVQVAHPLTEQERLNHGLVQTLLTLMPLALLVAGMGGAFLTDRAMRPVRRITEEAAQIGAHDLSRRLEVSGKDELSELAATFNAMIARLETAFQQMERAYEQQRRFTADASHELRTPLTTIKANTSLALSGNPTAAEYREALQAADEASDTMNRIVQDLLLLARSDGGQLEFRLAPVPVQQILERVSALVGDAESAPLTVQVPDSTLAVLGDAHHLQRLFVNLAENAVRHTPVDGRITLAARVDPNDDQRVLIRVQDTGEGIAPEHLPHVCERFYRADASRTRSQGGTGLGLSICQSIVQAHGGTLRIESERGHGTTVTVTLPSAAVGAKLEPRRLSVA